MIKRFYTLKADDITGDKAEGPMTQNEARLRQIVDLTMKILTADQLAVYRRRPAAKKATKG